MKKTIITMVIAIGIALLMPIAATFAAEGDSCVADPDCGAANLICQESICVVEAEPEPEPSDESSSDDSTKDTCEVTKESGKNVKNSLRRYTGWFNTQQKNYKGKQLCRDGITFADDVKTINLKVPVSLTANNPSGCSEGKDASCEFVLGSDHKVVLTIDSDTDFEKGMKEAEVSTKGDGETIGADGQSLGKCAIYIKTSHVRLKNLHFKGGDGSGVNGICIDAPVVTLEDVVVENFTGDAVRLTNRATLLDFAGKLNQLALSRNGIYAMGASWTASNEIDIPLGMVDDNLDLVSNREHNIYLPGTAYIVPEFLTMMEQKAGGKPTNIWDIRGQVVNCEEPTKVADGKYICPDGSPTLGREVETVYVYKQVKDAVGANLGIKELATYVTETTATTDNIIGGFSFTFDKNTAGTDKIFLIPKMTSGEIGSSTRTFGISSQPEVYIFDSTLGLGGGGGSGNFKKLLLGCSQSINAFKLLGSNGIDDSDNDGLTDEEESSMLRPGVDAGEVGGCDCNKTITCWKWYDTDHDGISDGAEVTPIGNDKVITTGVGPVADSDGDGIANANQNDSDGDGLNDSQEDRTRLYNGSWPAYYYYRDFYSGMDGQPVKDPAGVAVPCTLSATGVGIEYDWYTFGADGKPVKYNMDPNYTGDIVQLACMNSSLDIFKDFNGQYDGNRGETNARLADTDLDNVCDGDGTQCPANPEAGQQGADGMAEPEKYLNDRCPEIKVDKKPNCEPSCIENEVLASVNPTYLQKDANSMPQMALIDSDDNGTKDLYEVADWKQIPSLCSNKDVDGDQIPDCLERDFGSCAPSANNGAQLDPYKFDTDNDGTSDYSDNDPFGKGGDLYKLFSFRPILMCFVDRDSDGLRDCEEDINKDGGIIKDGTESDPLNADIDGDKFGDKMEKDYGTNPFNPDSDSDNLSDCEEICGAEGLCSSEAVVTGNDANLGEDAATVLCTKNVPKKSAEGCYVNEVGQISSEVTTGDLMAFYGDTEPLVPDTDEDGLRDGDEIKITHTNPNNGDSDNDELQDGEEDSNKNGKWPAFEKNSDAKVVATGEIEEDDYFDTNPCMSNTDLQGLDDGDEKANGGCPANPNPWCKFQEGDGQYGYDADSDGMPDKVELDWGTNPNDSDTDNDGLPDGCVMDNLGGELGELCEHFKTGNWGVGIMTDKGESDPGKEPSGPNGELAQGDCQNFGKDTVNIKDTFKNEGAASFCGIQIGINCGSDSDGDGLPDYYEKVMFHTFPNNPDSDGDGIVDGIETKWVVANEVPPLGSGLFVLVTQKGPEQYVALSMTNPLDQDTDKDTLADGFVSATNFEDKNCNGRVDTDINGNPIELDPRTGNSDGDSWDDKDEFCWDGVCGSGGNMSRATSAQREGCGNIGGAGGETWGMTLMFVIMLAATRVAGVVLKRTKRSRRACSARVK